MVPAVTGAAATTESLILRTGIAILCDCSEICHIPRGATDIYMYPLLQFLVPDWYHDVSLETGKLL